MTATEAPAPMSATAVSAIATSLATVGGAYVYIAAIFKHENGTQA